MDGNKVTIGVLIGVIVLGLWYFNTTPETGAVTPPVPGASPVPGGQQIQCAQNPSYTYSAVDAYSTTTVGGTDQIKENALKPVTTLANPANGNTLEYWKDNASYYCEKAVSAADCGAHTLQTSCYHNGTNSIKIFDVANAVFLTSDGGANNLTLAASSLANFRIDYQGQAKKSNIPFGGCIAVEFSNNVSSLTLSSEGVTPGCIYPYTYSPTATTNTYKLFNVPSGFDKAGLGTIQSISGQIQAGSSKPASSLIVTFQPAKHYITNAGEIVLGIEKDQNEDTTKTATGRVYTVKING